MDIKEEMKLRKWAQDMADQKASGLSQRKWCAMNGIGTTTFEYRCRRVRTALESRIKENESGEIMPVPAGNQAPVFAKVNIDPAPISSAPQSGIDLTLKHASISIAPDAPAEQIRMILEVLINA